MSKAQGSSAHEPPAVACSGFPLVSIPQRSLLWLLGSWLSLQCPQMQNLSQTSFFGSLLHLGLPLHRDQKTACKSRAHKPPQALPQAGAGLHDPGVPSTLLPSAAILGPSETPTHSSAQGCSLHVAAQERASACMQPGLKDVPSFGAELRGRAPSQ